MTTRAKIKNPKILKPQPHPVEVEGNITYGEGHRAFNTIRMTHQILREFSQLYEKRSKFGYKMTLHRNFKDLKTEINKIEKSKEGIPVLLWFYKESS